MVYTFESYDTELTPKGLALPKEIFSTESAVLVYPSPYMTVRISDEDQFQASIDSTERLPKKHREMIRKLMYGKALPIGSQRDSRVIYGIMRELTCSKEGLFKGDNPIPVHVENCGEYIQITAI